MAIKNEIAKYRSLMVKSNYIIEASYKLSLQEQRIIYILMTRINHSDENFKPYRFSVKEISNIIGTKHKNMYSEISKHVDSLRNRDLTIIKDNSILKTKWLSSAEYFISEGVVELEFSPKLKPYFLQLKQRFTKMDLNNVISFGSNYSCRVYELLKQYERIGERVIKIEDLKTMFCIGEDEYKLYADLKRKVILQAQKEINNKTDVNFEFQEIKQGRKVEAIKFLIKSQTSEDEVVITVEEETAVDFINETIVIIKSITGNEVSSRSAKAIYQNAKEHKEFTDPLELIKEVAQYSKTQNIKNAFIGWFKKTVKDYERPVKMIKKDNFNNYQQRQLDFDSLERQLLGWDKVEETQ